MNKSIKNKAKLESKDNDTKEIKSNIIEFKSNNTHNPYVNTILLSSIILYLATNSDNCASLIT